jgi:hypothetical protein
MAKDPGRYEKAEHTKNASKSNWDKHSGRQDPTKEKTKEKPGWQDRSNKR